MDLAARRSARQRENLVMRIGCFLVSFAVLASLVLEPPRAKAADALTLATVEGGSALLMGYLAACGMTPFSDGMSAREMTGMSEELLQEYINEKFGGEGGEGGGPSRDDWLGMITFTVANGVVRFGKAAAEKLNQFAQWVASKYATKPGNNIVFSDKSITFADGSSYTLATYTYINPTENTIKITSYTPGTPVSLGTKANPFVIQATSNRQLKFYMDSGRAYASGVDSINFNISFISFGIPVYQGTVMMALSPSNDSLVAVAPLSSEFLSSSPESDVFAFNFGFHLLEADDLAGLLHEGSLSLDVAATMQEVLDRLAALEEGQSVALDVGATQTMEIQDILQSILDAILAGELSASAEIVDEAEVPVDPDPPPVVPVVPEGLDRLGAALTSRFPFSIPWDVYKGVSLLAAPAKAPYFEVDFYAPIGNLVGGWKGSTKIVLDMSEYEIIGQLSRWASTIGFCLMLASGTKRLIWTA